MLTNLHTTIEEHLKINPKKILFFENSSTVLNWSNAPPYQLKPFVTNRISEIQAKTSINQWRHTKTKYRSSGFSLESRNPKLATHTLLKSGGMLAKATYQ